MAKDLTFAKVILASVPLYGSVAPIFTIHARYGRIFHSELMTHRVFSRNARSSRAVPVMTMIKEVWKNPFVPKYWGRNQRGMQSGAEITGWKLKLGRATWIAASKLACIAAWTLYKLGFHKQIGNRLLEPFSYIDVLISSTSWANFLHLRNHKDAEPHFQDLARMIAAAIEDCSITALNYDEWHLPYVTTEERDIYPLATCLKLSVARCARISYAAFDGDGSIERELERYELLVGSEPLHASPAEHQAAADKPSDLPHVAYENEHLSGNLGPGYIQYRKTLAGEYVADPLYDSEIMQEAA